MSIRHIFSPLFRKLRQPHDDHHSQQQQQQQQQQQGSNRAGSEGSSGSGPAVAVSGGPPSNLSPKSRRIDSKLTKSSSAIFSEKDEQADHKARSGVASGAKRLSADDLREVHSNKEVRVRKRPVLKETTNAICNEQPPAQAPQVAIDKAKNRYSNPEGFSSLVLTNASVTSSLSYPSNHTPSPPSSKASSHSPSPSPPPGCSPHSRHSSAGRAQPAQSLRNTVLTNSFIQKQQQKSSSISASSFSHHPPHDNVRRNHSLASTTPAATGSNNHHSQSSKEPFQRSCSNPEALSKDEARKRMLSWRKTTKFRKPSTSPALEHAELQ